MTVVYDVHHGVVHHDGDHIHDDYWRLNYFGNFIFSTLTKKNDLKEILVKDLDEPEMKSKK